MIIYSWPAFRYHFAVDSDIDPDGSRTWPTGSVNANGFVDTIAGIDHPITSFPVDIEVDSGAHPISEYHIYLSQRTDDAAKQYMSLAARPARVGVWRITLTALAVSELGLTTAGDSLTTAQLKQVLRHCTLYIQRISDDAIQFVDMLAETLSES